MATALATIAFVTALIAGAALLFSGAHRLLRPREMNARSATALRELEPRGGRHRFHIRLFEKIALGCASTAALGVLFLFTADPHTDRAIPLVGGGSVGVAIWWAWRRGTLRSVEASQQEPHE